MGGANAVIEKAQASYDKGDYRWVAEVMSHVVFAEPDNVAARDLEADALEQMGYQTENPTWRNEFLMGAYELRNGLPKIALSTASPDSVMAMPPDMLLDYVGLRLDGPKVFDKKISFNMDFGADGEYAVRLENGVLVYTADKQLENADLTVVWPKASFVGILFGATDLKKEIDAGHVKVEGDPAKLDELFAALVTFDPLFPIVSP
jgi:alkyl sulfatase BDS1-like metallo-beta-lactamase superfamily hydrolase